MNILSDVIYQKIGAIDVLSPSVAMTNITSTVCEMLEENLSYTKKNGLTESARKSRERLLRILDITELFNQISCDNASLKTHNLHLLGQNQNLKNQLSEIERQERIANSL